VCFISVGDEFLQPLFFTSQSLHPRVVYLTFPCVCSNMAQSLILANQQKLGHIFVINAFRTNFIPGKFYASKFHFGQISFCKCLSRENVTLGKYHFEQRSLGFGQMSPGKITFRADFSRGKYVTPGKKPLGN
jgi:hypothetical protein